MDLHEYSINENNWCSKMVKKLLKNFDKHCRVAKSKRGAKCWSYNRKRLVEARFIGVREACCRGWVPEKNIAP